MHSHQDSDANFKLTRVVVDSRDRDVTAYPDPASYTVPLEDPIEDVDSIELLNIWLPAAAAPASRVNARNNVFAVSVGNLTDVEVSLTPGAYTDAALANHVASSFNAALSPYVFAVTASADSVFTITCATTQFYVDAKYRSAQLLGLRFGRQASSYAGGQYRLQGAGPSVTFRDNYAVMDLNACNVLSSFNNVVNRTFAIVPILDGSNNGRYNLADTDCNTPIKKTFTPPIARYSKVIVSFRDSEGELFNFQNQDHWFELMIRSHKQRKYSMT